MQHSSDERTIPPETAAAGAGAAAIGAATTDTPILDTTAALDLMDGDMDTLLMVLALVRDQMPEDRQSIASAVDAHDAPSLKKACHRLKGVVGQIGAVRAHAACALLETAAANGEVNRFAEVLQSLAGELETLSSAITRYLSEQPAASA